MVSGKYTKLGVLKIYESIGDFLWTTRILPVLFTFFLNQTFQLIVTFFFIIMRFKC